MKATVCLVLLVVCVAAIQAQSAPSCRSGGISIPAGQKRPGRVGDCTEYSCDQRGRTSALACAESISNDPNLVRVEDKFRIYPGCCPRYVRRT